jgi:hypothetical protein
VVALAVTPSVSLRPPGTEGAVVSTSSTLGDPCVLPRAWPGQARPRPCQRLSDDREGRKNTHCRVQGEQGMGYSVVSTLTLAQPLSERPQIRP